VRQRLIPWFPPCLAVLFALIAIGGPLLGVGCSSVPYSERSQLRLISEEDEIKMGLQAYDELLAGKQIETDSADARMVEEVGRRLAAVSGRDYAWEFKLVKDDATVNAFCLPGGKIAVYTGILPMTRNADGLAAVMGHEIAHAMARHGAERVSQHAVARGALRIIEAGLSGQDESVRNPIMAALGLGTEVGVMLPYSRLHENEADAIGLRLMVRAGYNPHEAVRLWERMAAAEENRKPALLSTHPDPRDRAARIATLIPRIVAEERSGPAPVR